MKKCYYLVFLIFLVSQLSLTSQDVHYFFVKDAFQRSYMNPAFNNTNTLTLSSGFHIGYLSNGPTLADVTETGNNNTLIVTARENLDKVNPINTITGNSSVHTLDASVNFSFIKLSIGHAWRTNAWLEYTEDLALLASYGNAPYVGQKLELGPQIQYLNYNEIYLGAQKSFGNLDLGVKIKALNGEETLESKNHAFGLTTSEEFYQLTLDTDYILNTANSLTLEGIDKASIELNSISFDQFLKGNSGWAFDLGAAYQVNESLQLSASILDIGSITWDESPRTYSHQRTEQFDGIDISDYFNNDNEIEISDSLFSYLDFDESNEEFSTKLPVQFILGATYQINEKFGLGGLYHRISKDDRSQNTLAFQGNYQLGFINLGAMYSYKTGSPLNFGLSGAAKFGPLYGFISTDNIVGLIQSSEQHGNIRMGLSFGF